MSNNIVPINLSRVDYPLTKIANTRTWGVLKGCGENSYQRFPSTSFNNSQITITCNPPSNKTIVDRIVWIKNIYNLVFTGTSVSGNLIQLGANDAPRAQPIASTTNTVQVSLNNDQFSTNLNQYWTGLTRYHNTLNNRDEFLSMTPSFLDKSQQYSDLSGLNASARNPLGSYADSSDGEVLRGGYSRIVINSNTPTAANITLTVTEPLYLSPFIFTGKELESGLVGVNNMSIVMTNGDLSRVWSHSTLGNTISTLVVNLLSSEAQLHYLTANVTDVLPLQQSWPYFEITSYPTTVVGNNPDGSLAPNAVVVQSMNSIQIKAIPEKIYVFARRSDSTQTILTTDTFAGITNVRLTYGNRTGLLSSASQEELYQFSLKNGLKMNFTEFSKNIGSVICIKPGEDIGLDALSASGLLDNQTLTMDVTLQNLSAANIFLTLYIVVVNAGTVSMVNGSFMHQIGVFTSQDVLNLDRADAPSVPYSEDNSIYGGSWIDSVKNFFLRARDKIKPYAGPILDMIPDPRVQIARRAVGLALPKRCENGKRKICVPNKKKKKKGKGVLVGGEMMSRGMLKDRLMMD